MGARCSAFRGLGPCGVLGLEAIRPLRIYPKARASFPNIATLDIRYPRLWHFGLLGRGRAGCVSSLPKTSPCLKGLTSCGFLA